jgi:hypothetical protein
MRAKGTKISHEGVARVLRATKTALAWRTGTPADAWPIGGELGGHAAAAAQLRNSMPDLRCLFGLRLRPLIVRQANQICVVAGT